MTMIKSNTLGKLQKIRNGSVFDSPVIFIREFLQNSQRSRAKNVSFTIDGDTLVCIDDGCGCSNPDYVFTLDLSEWESTKEGYGIGFWACLCFPGLKEVTVESKGWKCSFDVDRLFATGDMSVKQENAAEHLKGFRVTLKSEQFEDYYNEIEGYMFNVAKYLPMTVRINEFPVPHYDLFDSYEESSFTMEYDNRLFKAKLEIDSSYYPSKSAELYYEKRIVDSIGGIPYVKGIIEAKNGKLTLKEPDRTSYVHDEKSRIFIQKIQECVRDLYKKYIAAYGVDDDGYSKAISYWLDLKDYERMLDFDDYMLQKAKKEENPQPVEQEVVNHIGSVEAGNFKKEDVVSQQTFHVAAKSSQPVCNTCPSKQAHGERKAFRDKVKSMKRSVWVSKNEYTMYSDEIQVARYKGLNVIIAKNDLYATALGNYGITHISGLEDAFREVYVKNDICLKNGKEEAFIALLQPICRKYGLADDTFLICNLSIESNFVVDGEVVFKRSVKNTRNNIQIYGVTDHVHIYLDRNALGLNRFNLKKGSDTVGIWEVKSLLRNVNTIAHEMAHLLKNTKDNTPEHYQAEIQYQNGIIELYA